MAEDGLEAFFGEFNLHLESLKLLGRVFEDLQLAGVALDNIHLSLLYFVDCDLPSLMPQRLNRRELKQVEGILSELSLPQVELRQSPLIMPDDWDNHDAWDSYYSSWDPERPIIESQGQWWQMMSFQRWTDKLRSDNRQTL